MSEMKSMDEIATRVEQEARAELKRGLSECTEAQQYMFKRMYARGMMSLSVDEVVDAMDHDNLDCAMDQVRRTLRKVCS